MIRPSVEALLMMGPLPDTRDAAKNVIRLREYERRLGDITMPVTDREAEALSQLFGRDDSFGLAWTLVHLIESAPGWPFVERLSNVRAEWRDVLLERASRK